MERFLRLSLEKLKLDYVDLYLIHFPVGFVGKHDYDLIPVDQNNMIVLDMKTDHVALWKVMATRRKCCAKDGLLMHSVLA